MLTLLLKIFHFVFIGSFRIGSCKHDYTSWFPDICESSIHGLSYYKLEIKKYCKKCNKEVWQHLSRRDYKFYTTNDARAYFEKVNKLYQ